jgi:hypothetical protein
MDAITRAPALRSDTLRSWPIDQKVLVRINESHSQIHEQPWLQGIGDTDLLEDPHDFAIDVDRPWKRVRCWLLFPDRNRSSLLRE